MSWLGETTAFFSDIFKICLPRPTRVKNIQFIPESDGSYRIEFDCKPNVDLEIQTYVLYALRSDSDLDARRAKSNKVFAASNDDGHVIVEGLRLYDERQEWESLGVDPDAIGEYNPMLVVEFHDFRREIISFDYNYDDGKLITTDIEAISEKDLLSPIDFR